jgi:hypothetical protein
MRNKIENVINMYMPAGFDRTEAIKMCTNEVMKVVLKEFKKVYVSKLSKWLDLNEKDFSLEDMNK